MKREVNLAVMFSMVMVGCVQQQIEKPRPVVVPAPVVKKEAPKEIPAFSGVTNADLITKAVESIDIPASALSKNGSILVASMENPADSELFYPLLTSPDKMANMVEDALVTKLTKMGLTPIERDYDVLTRLWHEQEKKYRIYTGPYNQKTDSPKATENQTAEILPLIFIAPAIK